MNKNIIVCIIFSLLFSASLVWADDNKQHLSFVKQSLSGWENNQYNGLKSAINNTQANGDLLEFWLLDYHLRTKPIFDQISPKFDVLQASCNNLYDKSVYSSLANTASSNLITTKKQIVTAYFQLKDIINPVGTGTSLSMDEELVSRTDQSDPTAQQLLALINDTILKETVNVFVLRADMVSMVKDIGKQFLLSDQTAFQQDKNEILSADTINITDMALVEHIMKRYLTDRIIKVDQNGKKYVVVDLTFAEAPYRITLIGSGDASLMEGVLASKLDPISGELQDIIEKVESGWLLMLKK